jgi:hypothetical protein
MDDLIVLFVTSEANVADSSFVSMLRRNQMISDAT